MVMRFGANTLFCRNQGRLFIGNTPLFYLMLFYAIQNCFLWCVEKRGQTYFQKVDSIHVWDIVFSVDKKLNLGDLQLKSSIAGQRTIGIFKMIYQNKKVLPYFFQCVYYHNMDDFNHDYHYLALLLLRKKKYLKMSSAEVVCYM